MQALDIRPGTVLPNGATVIAASLRNAHEWIILAVIADSAMPYATWKASRPGDGSDTRQGHYTESLGDALADFKERA